eukprot:8183879-Alexandrium_andersonii.AAC.1
MRVQASPSAGRAMLRAAPPAPGSAAGGVSNFRRFGAAERAVWPVGPVSYTHLTLPTICSV